MEALQAQLSTTQSELRERQDSYQRNMTVLTSKLREVANAREEARRALDAREKEEDTLDGQRESMEKQIQVCVCVCVCVCGATYLSPGMLTLYVHHLFLRVCTCARASLSKC